MVSPKEEIGLAVPHMDSKGEIEKYVKEQKVGLFDKLADSLHGLLKLV